MQQRDASGNRVIAWEAVPWSLLMQVSGAMFTGCRLQCMGLVCLTPYIADGNMRASARNLLVGLMRT